MDRPMGFDHSPFMRFLGLELVRAGKGTVEIRLPFREEFLRQDGSDWLHGGVVSSLADIVGFNPSIGLRRPQTIMDGAPDCDFRFEVRRRAEAGSG